MSKVDAIEGQFLSKIEHVYQMQYANDGLPTHGRVQYLAEFLFDFTTYDDGMSYRFGKMAVETCRAITERKTFDFIKECDANYMGYLTMVNMPFFADKIEWGTSIRGAWWCIDPCYDLEACGAMLCEPGGDLFALPHDQFIPFIKAVVRFADEEKIAKGEE